jgi:hypothetical protein
MNRRLQMLLIALVVVQPGWAWAKSERHDYRERAQLRQAISRALKPVPQSTPLPLSPWPGFQFDVF